MSEEEYKREIESLKAERRKREQDHQEAMQAKISNLEDLIGKVYRQNEGMETTLSQIQGQQEDFCIAINGTEDDPSKGLKVRVDRLEEKSKGTSWLAKTTLGTVIAAIVTWLFTQK